MNVFTFSGNLAADAEVRHTSGGESVTQFRVAASSGYGDKKTTSWITCNYWGKRGEAVAQYLRKGSFIEVTGEFSLREWTDKEGAKRLNPEVRVNDVTLPPRQSGEQKPAPKKPAENGSGFEDMEDDLPFN